MGTHDELPEEGAERVERSLLMKDRASGTKGITNLSALGKRQRHQIDVRSFCGEDIGPKPTGKRKDPNTIHQEH